jgi:hypothetical protein
MAAPEVLACGCHIGAELGTVAAEEAGTEAAMTDVFTLIDVRTFAGTAVSRAAGSTC